MSLHYATLSRSPRLQRALAALRENPRGLTTREWIRTADICACNSIAAELKAQGIPVVCQPEGRLFRYVLKESA
jgi:hypothetical protein